MTRTRTAVIVGGGIAGPVMALALGQAGIESTVYEAYATTAEGIGGVLMVAPNGLDALRIIGADLSTIGQPIQRMIMGDGSGKRFGEFAGLRDLPPSRVMWRSDLYRVLHDRAAARGIRIEYGKRLVGIDDTPTGVVARFADGSSASGDVLVGADGIRSTVRTLIDPSAPGPEYVGHLGFGGLATGSGVHGEPDAMHFVFGKRGFLGYWTQPDGGTLWFGNLPHTQPMTMSEAREVPAADWLRLLRDVYADDVPGRDLLQHTDADQLFVAGAGEILPTVPHWHRGRIVLVGDSAHAPSSSSGQGASLAAESAIQLARCLRDIPDVATAFAAYERLRRPRVEKVAAYAAKQNNRKVSGPIAKALMSVLMPIAMKTFLTPEKMFGWMHSYRIDWNRRIDSA
jgi:2-polyprenyl-6-methoxyphenol hydroxylase-like FAD-dependent oxidoreductase